MKLSRTKLNKITLRRVDESFSWRRTVRWSRQYGIAGHS